MLTLLPFDNSLADFVLTTCFQGAIPRINSCLSEFPRSLPCPLGPFFQLLLRGTNNVSSFLLQFFRTFLGSSIAERNLLVQVLDLLPYGTSLPFRLLNDAIGVLNERCQEIISNVGEVGT